VNREVIHLALAAYMADEPNKQVNRLACKIIRTTRSPKIKRAMRVVEKFPLDAAELARRVYWDEAARR